MNVYYLGPDGSYSHLLVEKAFDERYTRVPLETFESVVSAIQKDSEGVGVLAIENSISSSVHQTVDIMYDQSVCIIGEASLIIHMDLLGIPGSTIHDITDVYSHPQALAQSSHIIQEHNWKIHKQNSTTASAEKVSASQNPRYAAIGSSHIAKQYGLTVLKQGIANTENNMTRWVFVTGKASQSLGTNINKLTYIFRVKHEPGSLVAVLTKIAQANGNLTKIESRPLPGTNWEYGFWIDVEVPLGTHKDFDRMMQENTRSCRLVGAYEQGNLYHY